MEEEDLFDNFGNDNDNNNKNIENKTKNDEYLLNKKRTNDYNDLDSEDPLNDILKENELYNKHQLKKGKLDNNYNEIFSNDDFKMNYEITLTNPKEENTYLYNQIKSVIPEIDNDLKNYKIELENQKKTENDKIKSKEKNQNQNQNSDKIVINIDDEAQKERYDSLLSDDNIEISKENFIGGYHENIHLKNNNKIKNINSYKDIKKPAFNFPFKIDEFQERAITCLENHESVLVSAHTSAGKTVVAQYAISMALKNHQKVIYTSPIKALSNQKYRDLKETFEDVGLMTGDVTKNEKASCLVMTTEILRNMLFKGSEITKEIAWVIFDEVHYMKDRERGVVWEETIILLSNKINYVFLSATIPNAREFGMWICKLKKQPCNVIYTSFRPTPLKHYVFPVESENTKYFLVLDTINKNNGKTIDKEVIFHKSNFEKAMSILEDARNIKLTLQPKKGKMIKNNFKIGLRKLVQRTYKDGLCPVIIFCFSKKECERNAIDLFKYSSTKNKEGPEQINNDIKSKIDLTTDNEKESIKMVFTNAINSLSEEDKQLSVITNFLPILLRGIGIHHGGMLPILKETVELLFQEGLIKILFSTETFSMGINMPAKTVVFTSLKKFDGETQRYLGGAEYIQMSGRAGRRGIDKEGHVIVILDKYTDPLEVQKIMYGKPAPLVSSFQLSYNQLGNLFRLEGLEPNHILLQSFRQFQSEKSVPLLKKKLIKIYNNYLENDLTKDYEKFYLLQKIINLENELENQKNKLNQIIFQPKYLKKYLNLGRIIKLKIFGYGIIMKVKEIEKIDIKADGINNIITPYFYEEYMKNEIIKKSDSNINKDEDKEDEYLNNIQANNEKNYSEQSNKRLKLKNKSEINKIISNNQNDIEINELNKLNLDISQSNKEMVLDVLVSIKKQTDYNGALMPGKFESNETFGIVPFCITMLDGILNIKAKFDNCDFKDQNRVVEYGERLKEIIVRKKNYIQPINIIKENKLDSPFVTNIQTNIKNLEDKYNEVLTEYEDKYKEINQTEKNKCIELLKTINKIKTVIKMINDSMSLVMSKELTNMQRVMRRLGYLNNDNQLTQKGNLICDISGADELLTTELLFNGFFKDMTIEEIGSALYVCLSKEEANSKEEEEKTDTEIYTKINNIFDSIKIEIKKISDVLVECKMIKEPLNNKNKEDKENKKTETEYEQSFNKIYMKPVFQWIKGETFKKIIDENTNLYEGTFIRIIRRLAEFIKSFIDCANKIGDFNLKAKLEEIDKIIKRGLPFTASLYISD